MSGMKFVAGLLLDQIGYASSGPQARVVTQRLRSLFEADSDLFQLSWLQSRFATGSSCFLERLGSLLFPRLVPPADGLPMHLQLPGNFALAQAPVKELGGLQSSVFELVKITFDPFWITHARRLAQIFENVTILCDT